MILTWFFNVCMFSTSPNTPDSLPCIPAMRSMVEFFSPKLRDSQFFFKYLRKAISLTSSSNVMTASFSITILSSIGLKGLKEAILFVTALQDNLIRIFLRILITILISGRWWLKGVKQRNISFYFFHLVFHNFFLLGFLFLMSVQQFDWFFSVWNLIFLWDFLFIKKMGVNMFFVLNDFYKNQERHLKKSF